MQSPAAAPVPTGRQVVLIALGQGMLMVLGGVLALLVAQRFGKNVRTDAFFAAYAFYAVGLTLVQAFRLSAVSPLVRQPGPETVTRMLGAIALISLGLAVPMVLLAEPLGALLVVRDPAGLAARTLRILWLTLTCHLFAAMLAAILAVRGRFTVIGLAPLLSGIVSIGLFLALAPELDIRAAAWGLAGSALWIAGASSVVLLRTGWRPTALSTGAVRAMLREAGRLVFASAAFFGATSTYLVCMAVAARQGAGEATLFSYAFMLATIFVGAISNVTALVRSPALLAGDDRAANTAATGLWSFRFTLALLGPVITIAVLAGEPVVGFALGTQFSHDDVHRILVTLYCLVAWVLASAGAIFAIVELLARGALGRLATLAVVQVAALVALAPMGAAWNGIEGIAVALSLTVLGAGLVQVRWAYGRGWRAAAEGMAAATGRELAVVAAALVPALALRSLIGDETLATLGVALLAAVLVVVATAVAWPYEWRVLLGVVRHQPGEASVRA